MSPDGVARLKTLLATLAGAIAALALFAIMVLTLVDVSGRKAISTSVPGSLELTELLMVVVIFAGLPLVSLRSILCCLSMTAASSRRHRRIVARFR